MKIKGITLLLLSLWIPVTVDKLLDFAVFEQSLVRQPFDDGLAHVLAYVLPGLEALTILLLLVERLRRFGMMLSLILMLGFTLYIAAALAGAWEKLPCGCGSVISSLTWKQHFFFNLFFLVISGYGVLLTRQKRSGAVGGEAAEGWPA